jgi:hypothetical protein
MQVSFELRDAKGALVLRQAESPTLAGFYTLVLDAPTLASGLYTLTVFTPNDATSLKLLKQ